MFTLLVIFIVILIGLITFSLMLRHFRREIRDEKPIHFDFTIGELHALRNAGHLTQAEFERAQETVLRRSGEMERAPESARPVNDPKRGFDVIINPPPPPPS